MKDETLRSAFQGWDVLSATQDEVLAYESRLKQVLDEEAARKEAELRELEAHEKGHNKGKTKEKKATARRMLQDGLDVDMVAKYTELKKVKVQEMEKEIKK